MCSKHSPHCVTFLLALFTSLNLHVTEKECDCRAENVIIIHQLTGVIYLNYVDMTT